MITSFRSKEQWDNYIDNKILPVLKTYGVKRLHDLRAAYASEDYRKLTGVLPPCFHAGKIQCAPEADEKARAITSQKLGHFRTVIMRSYWLKV